MGPDLGNSIVEKQIKKLIETFTYARYGYWYIELDMLDWWASTWYGTSALSGELPSKQHDTGIDDLIEPDIIYVVPQFHQGGIDNGDDERDEQELLNDEADCQRWERTSR